ncbi:recombination protein RecR [Mycoplasmopsis californica HAZ160_1]|uniref:Recombination protein RecR n=2 Tax=Mycoplasmopsis californica TaxID=2113 RepID=A0A059XWL8_9BACT|nr:toprim domain-containing protein [Mycoplasmopsis californica]AIA29706.1 recombination protein RecR [Mycoplasmopsis californica]BAP00803.1 recombination protein RecR [Mycoplasmopsis californica HAZ160_1]BBG40658.1 recombination protein RecR [Mycoplasmopsis californica]BBG41253.1 recombination protein RecR [Mycoplasmopsis californica]BBG41846.1 recombination protein RecR [Mycoplasmopsis californica]
MKIETLETANEILKKIPGISKKQAERISTFLLNSKPEFTDELCQKLQNIHIKIEFCPKCNFIKENNSCLNCDDTLKTNSLMIVESFATANKIDGLGIFLGYYFVLPYLLELKKQIEKNDYNYEQLFSFVEKHNFEEIIIVISPSLEGEMTTAHLTNLFKEKSIKVSRAAIGMPMGSSLEYLDTFTIKQAINNRK